MRLVPRRFRLDKGLIPLSGPLSQFSGAVAAAPAFCCGGFGKILCGHQNLVSLAKPIACYGIATITGIEVFLMTMKHPDSGLTLATQFARSFTRAVQQTSAGLGFSSGQFPILTELWKEEGLTQRQLLDRVEVEQATIANTLSRMERDGLIERRPHPQDRRAQQIFLTQKSRDLQGAATTAISDAEDAMFAGFRRFERELLKEYMRRAIENVPRS